MTSTFKGKIGQLVSWDPSGKTDEVKNIGIVIEVKENGSVVVEFLKQDWIINLNTSVLKLLNDVDIQD